MGLRKLADKVQQSESDNENKRQSRRTSSRILSRIADKRAAKRQRILSDSESESGSNESSEVEQEFESDESDEDAFVVSDNEIEMDTSEAGSDADPLPVSESEDKNPVHAITLDLIQGNVDFVSLAAMMDNVPTRKLLGPDPRNKDRSLIHTACATRRADVLAHLLSLAKRAIPPSLVSIRELLEACDSDKSSCGGCTPIHVAAAMDSLECLKTLKVSIDKCRKQESRIAKKGSIPIKPATSKPLKRLRIEDSDEEEAVEMVSSDGADSDDDTEDWDTDLILAQDNEGFHPVSRAIAAKASISVVQFLLEWMKEAGCEFSELFKATDNVQSSSSAKLGQEEQNDSIDRGILFVAARMGRGDVFTACENVFGRSEMFQAMSQRTASGATILHYACAAAFIYATPATFDCVTYIVQYYQTCNMAMLVSSRDNVQKKASKPIQYDGLPKFSKVAALYAVGAGVPWDVGDESKLGEELVEIDYGIPKALFELDAASSEESADVIQTEEAEIDAMKAHQVKSATMLHFAALNNLEDVVTFLLEQGLPAKVKDKLELTPLIYAHMSESYDKVSDGCLLALLESDPSQLGDLLKLSDHTGKHAKLVKNLIKSLATKPRAYKFVNDFLRSLKKGTGRYEIIEWFSAFPALLDFKNKKTIFRRAIRDLIKTSVSLVAEEGAEFLSAYLNMDFDSLSGPCSVTATFESSVGSGPGVTREFWDNLSKDIIKPGYGVFAPFSTEMPSQPSDPNNGTDSKLPEHAGSSLFFARDDAECHLGKLFQDSLSLTRFAGEVCAIAILNDQVLPGLEILNPHVLRIVTQDKIEFSWKDFETLDQELYKGWDWLLENGAENVAATFNINEDVGGGKVVTRAFRGYDPNSDVTDENKAEFVRLSAKHWIKKYRYKIVNFREGFTSIIPRRILRVLKPTDLELILCGMPVINIDEWRKATEYSYWTNVSTQQQQELIDWFWSIVKNDMSEADRVLLLKFSTGQSRMAGSAGWKFNITLVNASGSKLPTSSTCFNQLKLPKYVSRDQLREKLLMAVRHGATGFEFC
ncbi:hypothetical protein HDU77_010752 [Chytriomyces hyalinus]|nr:hypothetical protein HDU77_010752 [Chytriomyces hyalinus]